MALPLLRRRTGCAGTVPGPRRVVEINLEAPLPTIAGAVDGRLYERAEILVRLHRHPLGVLDVELGGRRVTDTELASLITDQLGEALQRHLAVDGMPAVGVDQTAGLAAPTAGCAHDPPHDAEPLVSVVIATHRRPLLLQACLESVLAGSYERLEVIVVDTAPGDADTTERLRERFHGDLRVRAVSEPGAGAADARNRGLAEARGEIVAFLDDDLLVDGSWLRSIVGAFSVEDDVACVTALIMPVELETPAQVWLEEYGGFAKGFTRRVFDLDRYRPADPLYPYTVGTFGSGASMAFTADVLRTCGAFDSRLSTGGEDLDLFLQVLFAGRRIVYEPSAIVWHRHARDYPALRRKMFTYGAGLSALMTKWVLARPSSAAEIAVRLPAAARYALHPASQKNARKRRGYPAQLTRNELAGMLLGPLMFARSAWRARRSRARG